MSVEVTKGQLLLEEYKILSEQLHKHQTFIYSVMPGMLTLLGALLAFTATKDAPLALITTKDFPLALIAPKESPQNPMQWFWLAGAVAIALAYAWTAMSHSAACLLAEELVNVETQLNKIVGDAEPTLTFNRTASADGLGAAPFLRLFLLFANIPLLSFLGIAAYRSHAGVTPNPSIYWPVWGAAGICVFCVGLTAWNSRSTRAKFQPQVTKKTWWAAFGNAV